jgi:hypothetical protein
MLLTSIERVRLYCSGQSENVIEDTVANNRVLHNWLAAVSLQIEKELHRELEIKSRTEYFDVDPLQQAFWLSAFPIIDVVSVYEDSTGLWDGSESEIDDPIITSKVGRINLDEPTSSVGMKSLRVEYTGGLAYDPVLSIVNLPAESAASFTEGKYIIGKDSCAVGTVYAQESASLTIKQYYGQFKIGELLEQYDDEGGITPSVSSVTGTLLSFDRESLLNSCPDIVLACEAQIRYMRQHQLDFENAGTTKDGVTIRQPNPVHLRYPLREEVYGFLYPYIRTWGI